MEPRTIHEPPDQRIEVARHEIRIEHADRKADPLDRGGVPREGVTRADEGEIDVDRPTAIVDADAGDPVQAMPDEVAQVAADAWRHGRGPAHRLDGCRAVIRVDGPDLLKAR